MAKYNGWTNYETWAVALWIDNEPCSYAVRQDLAREAWDEAEDSRTGCRSTNARIALVDSLKAWVDDEMIPDLGATLAADLLSGAVSEVDWREIADNFLDETEGYESKKERV